MVGNRQGYLYGFISTNKNDTLPLEGNDGFRLVWISLTDDGLSLARGPWRIPPSLHYIVRKGEHIGYWKWDNGGNTPSRKLKLESDSCTLYLIAKTEKDAEE